VCIVKITHVCLCNGKKSLNFKSVVYESVMVFFGLIGFFNFM